MHFQKKLKKALVLKNLGIRKYTDPRPHMYSFVHTHHLFVNFFQTRKLQRSLEIIQYNLPIPNDETLNLMQNQSVIQEL